jgi:uncharacterized membrane protein
MQSARATCAQIMDETQKAAVEEKDTGRLEAFSDGVFAVAITLLALDLQVPHPGPNASARELAAGLLRQWPSYVAFITSFFTVLIMWVNHHGFFKMVHRTSPRLLFVNGYVLLMTTAVPFATSLVTQYLRLPGAKLACAVYGGTFVLISLGFSLLLRTVVRDPSTRKPDVTQETLDCVQKSWRLGPPLYVLATVGAFLSPYVAIGICTGLWVYWAGTAREF